MNKAYTPPPMLGLFRAEWQKATKNYMLAGFLVWIFPVGLTVYFAAATLVGLVSETAQLAMLAASSGQWTTDVPGIWSLMTAFPANIFPRMLPLAFMAVVFAGEYQWGTWKNLVPRSRRSSLILAKFAALIAIVMVSLLLTSLVIGVGQSVSHRAAGAAYGPVITTQVLSDFVRDYAREALLGMLSLIVLASYAAVAALLTRSILGGLLAGFGISLLEPMSFAVLILAGRLLNRPEIINLHQFTPTYSSDNIRSWLTNGMAFTRVNEYFTAEPGLAVSSFVLGAWIVGLVGLAVYVFERQDITS